MKIIDLDLKLFLFILKMIIKIDLNMLIKTCYDHSIIRKKEPSVILLVHDLKNDLNYQPGEKILELFKILKQNEKQKLFNINDSIIYSNNCHKACLDRKIKNKFSQGIKIILIKNLEVLPVDSVFLFYAYGDPSSNYKDVLILLTLKVPKVYEIKTNLTEFVETYLLEKWLKVFDSVDQLRPIFTRIANNVVLI